MCISGIASVLLASSAELWMLSTPPSYPTPLSSSMPSAIATTVDQPFVGRPFADKVHGARIDEVVVNDSPSSRRWIVVCVRPREALSHHQKHAIKQGPLNWGIDVFGDRNRVNQSCDADVSDPVVPLPNIDGVDAGAEADTMDANAGRMVFSERLLQEWGMLELGDRVAFQDGSLYDEYAFSASQGQTLLITLDSHQFDTYLVILNHRGDIIAENDDIDLSNTNSQLVITPLSDEQYWIVASGFSAKSHGCYHLTVWGTFQDSPDAPNVPRPDPITSP